MKKISIIIPCYNAVSCIDSCMKSIVSQTMAIEDMEIILVNDASTDDTLAKLCAWEERYPESILVVNCEENGKQGKARDIGMQYASGEYIGFMDDDDWIEPEMYETLYAKAIENNCDLVICQSVKHGRNENPKITLPQQDDYLVVLQSLEDRKQFLELDFNIAIWNKLYKRELLFDNAIDFPPGYIYDDIYFSALVKRYCQRVYVCQKIMYHHIISETSVSYGSKNPTDRIGFIEVHMMLVEELKNRGLYQEFQEWYDENFVIDYLTFITNYEKSFGALDEEIASVIKSGIWELFPHFASIPLVQALAVNESKPVYKQIICSILSAKPTSTDGVGETDTAGNHKRIRVDESSQNRQKIDILVAVGEKGGVENVINMTVPYLQEQGMEIRVVQLVSSGVNWTSNGIPHYNLLEGLQDHTLLEFSESYAHFMSEHGVPDCVLATAWPSMCYVAKKASLLVDKSDTPVISWLHAPVKRYEDAGYGSYNHLELADAHFAISKKIYEDIQAHFPNDIVEYIRNPVNFEQCITNTSTTSNVTTNIGMNNQANRLYYVGRVSEEKRLDVIIQGVAAAGDSWELYVIGDDNSRHGQDMKKLAKLLGAEQRIHWLGWQQHPWKKVEGAAAVVVASEYEGFCLAAVEAQANGIPVITTPVGVMPDIIVNGMNGYIYPFGDWKKLSDILYGMSTKQLPPLDANACVNSAQPFEKNRAVADFYQKLCKVLTSINDSDENRERQTTSKKQKEYSSKQETNHMTRQQIYGTNIQLQSIIQNIIYACHTQNYDRVVRTFTDMTNRLMSVLESVFEDVSFYNQELELVNPEGVSASLQDILAAQENKDYVLLADLLELQMVPFLQSLQEAIRTYDMESVSPTAWESNMSVLKNKDEALWKQITAYHEEYEKANAEGTWQGAHHLEDTNCGAFTMAGQDAQGVYYYHSNVNPLKEAADFARYYYQPGCEEYVIWGLGLGYHLQEMMKLDDGIHLTIYESDMDVIYHCLNAVDLSACLGMANVTLIYDPQFIKITDTLENITENFILHYPSLRHIENERIRQQMEMFFIRDSGKRNAAILFENNSRENFKNYDGYVDELRPAFEDKDVVIVAAGPSLDKNVELLKNKKPNMVIVAVETVFRKLINLGVDMDYIIVADANSRIYWHLNGLEDKQVPMLFLSTAYKGFSQNYQGPKYLICQNGYNKAEELAQKNGWKLYETGGSVSTTALDVCISLGAKSIAFIGLDLAYTDNKAHATGAAAREATGLEEMQQVSAIGGGTVPASKLFMIYNKWIEKRIQKEDVTMPVYDATEGGAIVPGLEIITLQEYIRQ